MSAASRLMTYLDRDAAEQRLIELCAAYHLQIEHAWREHHIGHSGHLRVWLSWALAVEVVSPQEDAIWRQAMVLRNAILQREFRIILADIAQHSIRLEPIIEALPARIAALPAGTSNVVKLR